MRPELTLAPANPAIVIADVKVYAYAQNDSRDDELAALIPVAISQVENFTGRRLVNQEYDIWYDRKEFFGMLGNGFAYLSTFNVTAIDSITLFAVDGTETVVDDSTYRLAGNQAKFDQTQPSGSTREMDAVRISIKTGYGADKTEIPDALKTAMYALISTWYLTNGNLADGDLNRIPDTVKTWLAPFRSTMNWLS